MPWVGQMLQMLQMLRMAGRTRRTGPSNRVRHEPDDCECGESSVEDEGTQTPGRPPPDGDCGSEQEERGAKCGAMSKSHG